MQKTDDKVEILKEIKEKKKCYLQRSKDRQTLPVKDITQALEWDICKC